MLSNLNSHRGSTVDPMRAARSTRKRRNNRTFRDIKYFNIAMQTYNGSLPAESAPGPSKIRGGYN